jgi:HAD superfamily hydrolase (TIGR01509 family)
LIYNEDFDAVLFDFDGTLVDSEPLHFAAWNQALAPLGVTLSWSDYEANCIGVADRAMVEQLAAALAMPFERLFERFPRKKELFQAMVLDAPPMPGEIVRLLQEEWPIPIGLVTSSYSLEVEPVLERLGLAERFGVRVFGDQVANLKPHPEPYLRAAEALGAKRPLVFEDSAAGIASAQAAGFPVVQVPQPEDLPRLVRSNLSKLGL